ncbi:MAG: helix-turn-helix domain-containing protein [Oscillospiraceae bacterium]|nr:helix-turn-helix domain-containing protein [Oscillospiraceae bacterium]
MCEDNDYKQIKIANYLNIKQGTYSDYERGEINVPVEALMKLAVFYNTSVDYLIDLTNEKKPYPRIKP